MHTAEKLFDTTKIKPRRYNPVYLRQVVFRKTQLRNKC